MEKERGSSIKSSDGTAPEVIYDATEEKNVATSAPSSEKSGEKSLSKLEKGTIEAIAYVLAEKVQEATYAKVLPRLIECLGVFVALFTFVSVNIQIFSNVASLKAALILVISIFLCLAGFVYLLHIVLSEKKNSIITFSVIAICGFVLAYLFARVLPEVSLQETSKLSQISQRLSILEKTFEMFLKIKN